MSISTRRPAHSSVATGVQHTYKPSAGHTPVKAAGEMQTQQDIQTEKQASPAGGLDISA